jgi:hypothetical protein
MRLKGDYDAAQDRILLKLWDASPSGDVALWLTRRQWLAIALACYRARSSAAQQGEQQPVRPRKNDAGKESASGPGKGGEETVKASLVSSVKFQRIPSGLRIKMTTKAPAPLFLTLKGENFTLFTRLVERLAAKAKWDLPLAISRMGNAITPKKRLLH